MSAHTCITYTHKHTLPWSLHWCIMFLLACLQSCTETHTVLVPRPLKHTIYAAQLKRLLGIKARTCKTHKKAAMHRRITMVIHNLRFIKVRFVSNHLLWFLYNQCFIPLIHSNYNTIIVCYNAPTRTGYNTDKHRMSRRRRSHCLAL